MTEEQHSINSILVLVDSPEANIEGLMRQAIFFSRQFGAKLMLLHVSSPNPDFVGYDAGPQSVRDNAARALRAEHHAMQSLAETAREQGINAAALSVQGDTVEKILLEVEKLRADMVIAASHHHGLLYRLVYGDLAQALLKTLACPILLIPD